MTNPRLPAPDRRRQLIETALDLFSRKGFQGATTREIAAAAGVTEAIIFRHFPTKQDLYNAVINYPHESGQVDAIFAEWKSFMDANDDIGLFRSILRLGIEGYRRDARLKRALLFAALEGHESGLAQHRQRTMPIFEPMVHYIGRRQSEGAIRPGNPAAILIALVGMANQYGMLTEFFGFCPPFTDEQMAEDFLNLILHGVEPAPAY